MEKKYITKISKVLSWEILVLFLYAGTMLFTVFHHEPWRDEAQAWLVARDLPILSIFKRVCYDGTPALWHCILAFLSKLGFPYISLNLINLLIIFLAATVFICRSPFSKLTKILFIFSYYIAWEYSIIARSYSISVLLLFLMATYYVDRFKKPTKYAAMIFLLFNTNVHSFFIAASFVAFFLLEIYKNKEINIHISIAVFIMIFGALLAFLQLLSPPDNFHGGLFAHFDLSAPLFAIGNAFFPHMSKIAFGSSLAGIVILFISSVYLFKNYRIALLILLASYSGLFYIFIFKEAGSSRHHGFILILLFVALWISSFYKDKPNSEMRISHFKNVRFRKLTTYSVLILMLNISLSLSILPCAYAHFKEYTSLFSGSKIMAEYLKSNHLTNNIIVAHRSPPASAILPYIPGTRFWYADIEQFGTYVTWNKKYGNNQNISFEEIVKRINKHHFSESNILILLNNPIPKSKSSNYILLKKVKDNVFGYGRETFYLYRKL